MEIEVSGDVLSMANDWKAISKHVKRVPKKAAQECEAAIRDVLSRPESNANAAVVAEMVHTQPAPASEPPVIGPAAE